MGDEFEDGRLDGFDEFVESIGEGALDIAVELHACSDADEIDWKSGVRADEGVVFFRLLRAQQHEAKRLLRSFLGLIVYRLPQGALGILRNLF